ncbi:MAG: DUF5317 family protein [Parcubacteria group bacterium]|nr:DUF5317 family protein [Parcubacteria group bacterium]
MSSLLFLIIESQYIYGIIYSACIFFVLMFLGRGMNLLVMFCNKNKMPIRVTAMHKIQIRMSQLHNKHEYVPMSSATHLNLFGDIIPIPHIGVASLGDIFIFAAPVLGFAINMIFFSYYLF